MLFFQLLGFWVAIEHRSQTQCEKVLYWFGPFRLAARLFSWDVSKTYALQLTASNIETRRKRAEKEFIETGIEP